MEVDEEEEEDMAL